MSANPHIRYAKPGGHRCHQHEVSSSGYESQSSTLETIRHLCEHGRCDEQTISAIHSVCNRFDPKSDSYTSSSTIDAIREVCNDFHLSVHSRDGSDSSPTTIDAIREICINGCKSGQKENRSCRNLGSGGHHPCRDCGSGEHHACRDSEHYRSPPYYPYPMQECFNPGGEKFQSIITPVTNLTPQFSGMSGTVQFLMRRKNRTVTLQWEPFSGIMAASGIAFLTVAQSINNLPPYPMSWPIKIKYRDVVRTTNITVDPHGTNGNILFSLNADDTGTGVNIGDSFFVYASSVDWIVQ